MKVFRTSQPLQEASSWSDSALVGEHQNYDGNIWLNCRVGIQSRIIVGSQALRYFLNEIGIQALKLCVFLVKWKPIERNQPNFMWVNKMVSFIDDG